MRRAAYIVLVGPDGCGKTTIADRLMVELAKYSPVRRMNFSFGFLPSISSLLGQVKRDVIPEGTLGAGMVKPQPLGKVVLLAIWYGLDHVLGHVALRCARKNEIFIFARSYHDFLYQRSYLNLPLALPRLMLALGPSPLLVASLVRDPRSVHIGKPELSGAEIADQYFRIKGRLARYCYFAEIDASLGIESTVDQVLGKIPVDVLNAESRRVETIK